MSSFRFEQHGAVGKLILLGDADSEPGSDFPRRCGPPFARHTQATSASFT